MSKEKLQIKLIKHVLKIKEITPLKLLLKFVGGFFNEKNNLAANEENYLHPKGISFVDWNEQFSDTDKLNTFDEENGITLYEFRKSILKAEQGDELPIEKLYGHLNRRINKQTSG